MSCSVSGYPSCAYCPYCNDIYWQCDYPMKDMAKKLASESLERMKKAVLNK